MLALLNSQSKRTHTAPVLHVEVCITCGHHQLCHPVFLMSHFFLQIITDRLLLTHILLTHIQPKSKLFSTHTPMGAVISTLAQVWFGVALAIPMLTIAILIKLLSLCCKKKTLNGLSVILVKFAWQISLWLTPWIWLTSAKSWSAKLAIMSEQIRKRAEGESNARPVFILGNHTSFLDTVLTITRLPISVAWQARTYMGAHLFKLPILSTICYGCGHFSVPYQGKGDDDFRVDKIEIAKTQKLVDQHIENKGVLCFFPEGAMNGNPSVIREIRYGGMKKALAYDAIIWTFITNGNQVMWPRKKQIGGFAGYGQYALKEISPIGCRALVAKLKKQGSKEDQLKEDYVILSEYIRTEMQSEWNDLLDGSSQLSEDDKKKDN